MILADTIHPAIKGLHLPHLGMLWAVPIPCFPLVQGRSAQVRSAVTAIRGILWGLVFAS